MKYQNIKKVKLTRDQIAKAFGFANRHSFNCSSANKRYMKGLDECLGMAYHNQKFKELNTDSLFSIESIAEKYNLEFANINYGSSFLFKCEFWKVVGFQIYFTDYDIFNHCNCLKKDNLICIFSHNPFCYNYVSILEIGNEALVNQYIDNMKISFSEITKNKTIKTGAYTPIIDNTKFPPPGNESMAKRTGIIIK